MRRMIGIGESIPRGYGVAWHEPWRDGTVCYPLGLNWIARYLYRVYLRLLRGPARSRREASMLAELTRRYNEGYDLGYEQGRDSVKREIEAGIVQMKALRKVEAGKPVYLDRDVMPLQPERLTEISIKRFAEITGVDVSKLAEGSA